MHILTTISVCIIAKNEEKNIGQLINNVKDISDEIIVVDNNSVDKTTEIAQRLGARVIVYDGDKEYEQRNLYIKEAGMDWILVLDADERIDSEKFLAFKNEILENSGSILAYYLPIINFFGEGKWAETTIVRLFRNKKELYYEKADIHTSVMTAVKNAGNSDTTKIIGILDVPVYHLDGLLKKRGNGKRERYPKLITDCINRYKGSPMEMKFHNYLGIEHAAAGRYDDAYKEFEVVAQKGGNINILPLYYMARAKLMDGDILTAEKCIDAYLDRCETGRLPFHPSILKERKNRGMITKADILCRKKEYDEALDLLETMEETAACLINKYYLLKKMNIVDIRLLKYAINMNPYMRDAGIYKEISRPSIYEFQSNFIFECEDIKHELVNKNLCDFVE